NYYAMSKIAVHPFENYFAVQSSDNQILVFDSKSFKQIKKKFNGHVLSGFQSQINFSPDGKYIITGDLEGKLWIFDWKNMKNIKLKSHNATLSCSQWHPLESSKIVTAGYDNVINLWD